MGADCGLGRRRVTTRHRQRVRAAHLKRKKCLSLRTANRGKFSPLAWRASALAQHGYACLIQGCTHAEKRALRASFAAMLDGGKTNRCATTLIACVQGLDQDPWVALVQRQVREWLMSWAASVDMRRADIDRLGVVVVATWMQGGTCW